jgi:hypothetical protein
MKDRARPNEATELFPERIGLRNTCDLHSVLVARYFPLFLLHL